MDHQFGAAHALSLGSAFAAPSLARIPSMSTATRRDRRVGRITDPDADSRRLVGQNL
jgi:hypothetical protein